MSFSPVEEICNIGITRGDNVIRGSGTGPSLFRVFTFNNVNGVSRWNSLFNRKVGVPRDETETEGEAVVLHRRIVGGTVFKM